MSEEGKARNPYKGTGQESAKEAMKKKFEEAAEKTDEESEVRKWVSGKEPKKSKAPTEEDRSTGVKEVGGELYRTYRTPEGKEFTGRKDKPMRKEQGESFKNFKKRATGEIEERTQEQIQKIKEAKEGSKFRVPASHQGSPYG